MAGIHTEAKTEYGALRQVLRNFPGNWERDGRIYRCAEDHSCVAAAQHVAGVTWLVRIDTDMTRDGAASREAAETN